MFFLGVYTHIDHSSHFLMLAEELSTIPLNIKTIYHQRARIRDFFARLFVITFILSRLIYGTIICSYTFRGVSRFTKMAPNLDDTKSIVLVIAQVLLFILTRLLNLYWTVLIMRKLSAVSRSNKSTISSRIVEESKKTR